MVVEKKEPNCSCPVFAVCLIHQISYPLLASFRTRLLNYYFFALAPCACYSVPTEPFLVLRRRVTLLAAAPHAFRMPIAQTLSNVLCASTCHLDRNMLTCHCPGVAHCQSSSTVLALSDRPSHHLQSNDIGAVITCTSKPNLKFTMSGGRAACAVRRDLLKFTF